MFLTYLTLALVIVAVGMMVVILITLSKQKAAPIDVVDEQKELQNQLKLYLQKEYYELKMEMNRLFSDANKTNQTDLNTFKDNMMVHIERQLKEINEKVEQRLGQGFEKTTETFTNVIERLSKIDEAQKKIEALSSEVISLNDLLTDKKTRGIFGEVQLYQLLTAVLGDNKALYEKQKTLSNGAIADAVVYAPDPVGMTAIDSKFPLDNYKRMVDRALGDADRKQAEKDFKADVKKHINDIKDKYIIVNETGQQAFMFVPAEAIFAEITAYHQDLIEYANKYQIWLVSPTTLISSLTIIQTVIKNIETSKQAQDIIAELNKLGDEFRRYNDRWTKFKRSLDTVSKTADQIQTTSDKISKKFRYISEAKFNLIEDEDLIEIDDDETTPSD